MARLSFAAILLLASISLGARLASAQSAVEDPPAPEEEDSPAPEAGEPKGAGEADAQLSTQQTEAQARSGARIGLFGRPVVRQGFHFQVGFGVGGGPDTAGIFHEMEIGYTFSGHTVAMLHTFIQNKGALGTDKGGPDLIGGWMLQYKHPLFFPDLVGKVALGLGGIHDQSNGSLKAHGGFGASYGVDLHYPIWPRTGPTLSLTGMNVTALGQHHFGASLGLAWTLF